MNDPHDLRVLRSRAQLESFWTTTEKEIDYRWARAELTRLPNPQPAPVDRLLYSFVATRFLKNLPYFYNRLLPPAPAAAPDTPAAPPDPTTLNFKYFILDDEFAVVQPFFTRALTVMAGDCRRQQVRLHVVHLPAIFCEEPAAFEARDKLRSFIREVCTGLELDYLDLTDRFTERDFFPVDGHFSPAGHATLATILAEHLAAAPSPRP